MRPGAGFKRKVAASLKKSWGEGATYRRTTPNPWSRYTQKLQQQQQQKELQVHSDNFVFNPVRAPKSLPVLNSSNFPLKNGFPVVTASTSPCRAPKLLPILVLSNVSPQNGFLNPFKAPKPLPVLNPSSHPRTGF